MLNEQIEYGFDESHKQVTPLSMLIQLEKAPELIDVINQHVFLSQR